MVHHVKVRNFTGFINYSERILRFLLIFWGKKDKCKAQSLYTQWPWTDIRKSFGFTCLRTKHVNMYDKLIHKKHAGVFNPTLSDKNCKSLKRLSLKPPPLLMSILEAKCRVKCTMKEKIFHFWNYFVKLT